MEYQAGWDKERVERLLEHYEWQTEAEAVREDEALSPALGLEVGRMEKPTWVTVATGHCVPKDWKKAVNGTLPPAHEHVDGTWWWYDWTWGEEYGPFETEQAADFSCKLREKKKLR